MLFGVYTVPAFVNDRPVALLFERPKGVGTTNFTFIGVAGDSDSPVADRLEALMPDNVITLAQVGYQVLEDAFELTGKSDVSFPAEQMTVTLSDIATGGNAVRLVTKSYAGGMALSAPFLTGCGGAIDHAPPRLSHLFGPATGRCRFVARRTSRLKM